MTRHAVAHVMEMQGRASATGLPGCAPTPKPGRRDSFFAVHNWWHLALYHLELGRGGRSAGALFDGPIYGRPFDGGARYGRRLGPAVAALPARGSPSAIGGNAVADNWEADRFGRQLRL